MQKRIIQKFDYKSILRSAWFNIFIWFSLILAGTIVFYLRYPYAYIHPNFYAEDGTILLQNFMHEGAIRGALSLFNGYLIIGQYIVFEIAELINTVFGQGIVTLPKAIALSSYLFFSFMTSLPFLLFRKKLGTLLAILCCMALWIFPLGGYDYAVIGTIGNIKFGFLFMATLLILYRNDKLLSNSLTKIALTDIGLLICVLTNITAIALLPFALIRYKKEIHQFIVKKIIPKVTKDIISLVLLFIISGVYLALAYMKGIPEIPGYLDGPIQYNALIDIVYRSTLYALIIPISSSLNDMVVYAFLALLLSIILFRSKEKAFYITAVTAILINVIAFVANRPGVTSLYTTYTNDGGPGHFFYAGTLIFVFIIFYAIRNWFNRLSIFSKSIFAALLILYIISLSHFIGFRNVSYEAINSKRPTIYSEVDRVCKEDNQTVEIGLYPLSTWTIKLDRDQVCR